MKNKTSKITISPEFDFYVKTPLAEYQGEYVAIIGRKVVAHGKNAKEVWDKAKKKYPSKLPALAKIPKRDLLILGWK